MNYRLNPTALDSIFAVPSGVVDDYLRLAGSAQLKLLLCLLRDGTGFDLSACAARLGLSAADAADALQFWMEVGILQEPAAVAKASSPKKSLVGNDTVDDSPPAHTMAAPPKTTATRPDPPSAVKIAPPPSIKPTRDEVSLRAKESAEIAFLFQEAQAKMGKTLSYDAASTLLWLCDHAGVCVQVLMMVIEYAYSVEKCNIRYIEKIALDWVEQGIQSVELAEKKLSALAGQKSAWGKIAPILGATGRPATPKELEASSRWVEQWGFSAKMIRLAYNKCVDATGKVSMAYINRVLCSWHDKGIKTPADAENEPKKAKSTGKKPEPSFDLSVFEDMSYTRLYSEEEE